MISDISNKHSLNSCHLNDFKCSNPFNISNLKTENICTGFNTFAKIGSYTNVEKKTSEKKMIGMYAVIKIN